MAIDYSCNQRQNRSHDVSSKMWQFRRIFAQVRIFIYTIKFNLTENNSNSDRIFSFVQFLATSVKNLLLIEFGLQLAITSIVIPALTNIRNDHNLNETLLMTPIQSSWLGKFFALLCFAEKSNLMIFSIILFA